MPRHAGFFPAIAPICIALAVSGCSSNSGSGWIYGQYFELVKQSFAGTFGKQEISRQDAAAIPYASMGYRVDGDRQKLLVLATDTNGDQLWTAKSRVVILTRNGRISRTVGLPHDISAVTSQNGHPLPAPSVALHEPVSTIRLADFPDISAYGVPLACSATEAGSQAIVILGNTIRAVRVDEACHSASLGWSFVDSYWIEPQTGLIWRSIQHIHPKGETIETETLRPPG